MNYDSKTELPVHTAILVCEVRGGELWPLGRIDLRTDDHAAVSSGKKNAPLMIAPLEKAHAAAVRLAAAQAAQMTIAQLGQSQAENSTPADL